MHLPIALLAALDTKAQDAEFISARLRHRGHEVVLIDVGVLGPGLEADVTREEVAAAAGHDLAQLREVGDRSSAVAAMAAGASEVVRRLYESGEIRGVFAIGGGAGTTIGGAAMRGLPLGFPKAILSTVASGDTQEYVGTSDIVMFPSIVDVAGVNRISEVTYSRAADAFAGMVAGRGEEHGAERRDGRPLIAASMFGVTTPCVLHAKELLDRAGCEVLVFHATGIGGRTMERLIEEGYVDAVLDLTTTEWADEIVGGILSAGPERLGAAAASGVPQVVSVGATDMVNFGAPESVPERFSGRKLYRHNAANTLMRVTAGEATAIGAAIADKLNGARGRTTLLLPLRGVSALDAPGEGFDDPAAREALFRALRAGVDPARVRVEELDLHINDEGFANAAAEQILRQLAEMASVNVAGAGVSSR